MSIVYFIGGFITISVGVVITIKQNNKKVFETRNKERVSIKEGFCDNDISLSNALGKSVRKNNDYPTKEEFEEHKKQIQQKELESDRFKNVEKFLDEYHKRENKELEEKLFKIVGTYGLEDHLINKGFDEIGIYKTKRYNELKNFMNSLTQDQINSNLYLKTVATFMETSIEDCNLIIKQLKKQISNLELSDKNQRLELNIDIPKERLELFPTRINEQAKIPYYRPQDYKMEYVNMLDEENSHKYAEYNRYVENIDKLATDVYHLQMWNLLSAYPEQIYNYYFSIRNNSYEHKFKTAYSVKKCRDINIVKSENEIYQLSEKTKENISRVIGLPFNEIVNMDIEDIRRKIDHIPIDEELDGSKLVLKRKNSSKSK